MHKYVCICFIQINRFLSIILRLYTSLESQFSFRFRIDSDSEKVPSDLSNVSRLNKVSEQSPA